MFTKGSFGRTVLGYIEIVAVAFVLSWGLRSTIVEARVIPSGSMLPTIQLQDRVVVDKIAFKFSEILRGDIIVFRPPSNVNSGGTDYIKRIIGLPGEKIEVKTGKVFINDRELTEPYEMEEPKYSFGAIVIPENSYFVMGDNRNSSNDSHEWGVLPKENIIGKALFRYWPLERFGYMAK